MSLFRLNNYRAGDLSEYIAQFFITRLAYSASVPRQEDFGVADFVCFRTEKNKRRVYAKSGFYLQVKAKPRSYYLEFNGSFNLWILENLDLPFLLCIVDNKKEEIELFSSWRILYSIMNNQQYKIDKMKFFMKKSDFGKHCYEYNENDKVLSIALHKPIIKKRLVDIINMSDEYEKILKFWVELERKNLHCLRTHKSFFVWGIELGYKQRSRS